MNIPDTTAIEPLALDHVVLRVKDIRRACAKYAAVLGCKVERVLPSPALTQLRAGASPIGLKKTGQRTTAARADQRLARAGNYRKTFILLVGAIGLEPTTPTMSRWCSNQLSYAPKIIFYRNRPGSATPKTIFATL
jgi:hypothetical protein